MAEKTKIEWTDATWNPITGCWVVSPGCANCYAMRLAGTRLRLNHSRIGLTTTSKAGPVWNGKVRFNDKWLEQPLQWKRPRMIFVCAHGDLFYEKVPYEWIDKVFAVMARAPHHTFQVLTKRSARMRTVMEDMRRAFAASQAKDAGEPIDGAPCLADQWPHLAQAVASWPKLKNLETNQFWGLRAFDAWPLPNVWMGVSVEDQRAAEGRIAHLLNTPAAVRWVSAEPLLGPIDFNALSDGYENLNALTGLRENPFSHIVTRRTGTKLDWIVSGDESGPGRRHCDEDWHRSIQEQCASADVPYHLKQRIINGVKVGNPPLDGAIHDAFPEVAI